MFHHVAIFRFNPSVSENDVAGLAEDLTSLSRRLDGLVSYACGTDLGMRDGNDDFAVSAVFDSAESVRDYLNHPEHLAIVKKYVAKMVAEKHGVQFVAQS